MKTNCSITQQMTRPMLFYPAILSLHTDPPVPWKSHGALNTYIKLRDWSSVTQASASSSSAETWWHFVTCGYLPKKDFVDLHRKKGPTVATAVLLVVLETA